MASILSHPATQETRLMSAQGVHRELQRNRRHQSSLPGIDSLLTASSNTSPNIVPEPESTEFVKRPGQSYSPRLRADDFFLDLGGAAEDPRDRITVSTQAAV